MDDDNIEERISSLKSEIKSYGSDILKHISALYSCNSTLPIDLKNDPRNILKVCLLHLSLNGFLFTLFCYKLSLVQMLQIDVKQILSDAQEHSAYTALHKEDIQACAALTDSLEAVAAASSALETAEEAILSSDLSKACDALVRQHSTSCLHFLNKLFYA